jgi:hypothetical protein
MKSPSQTERLYNLLSDNQPHRTDEIVRVVYPSANYCPECGRGDMKSLARVGARVADLKDGKWRGKTECLIRGWHDPKNQALYWYQMSFPLRISAISARREEELFELEQQLDIPMKDRFFNSGPKVEAQHMLF